MSAGWMPGVHVKNLMGRSNGSHNNVAGWRPKGVVLHVNDSPVGSRGTSIDWYATGGGNDSVCPTWQVYPDGETWQLLPATVQPWCQADGNSWGLAIETGGNHAEPLTPAAVQACAAIMRWVHDEYGVPLQVTDSPSRGGLGTHAMGGTAWGGHSCPGTIRARQRNDIITLAANGHSASGGGTPLEDDMPLTDADAKKVADEVWSRLWKSPSNGHNYRADQYLVAANGYALAAKYDSHANRGLLGDLVPRVAALQAAIAAQAKQLQQVLADLDMLKATTPAVTGDLKLTVTGELDAKAAAK